MADERAQAEAALNLALQHENQIRTQTNNKGQIDAAVAARQAAAQRLAAIQARPAPSMDDHADTLHPTAKKSSAPTLFRRPLY